MDRIPVAGPLITQKEIDYVTDAVTNAWYGNANMYHARFEKAFCEYVGRKYAMALPSATSAIHHTRMVLGVSAGDEVIIPDSTWIALGCADQLRLGATPVFVDVGRGHVVHSARDPSQAAITDRTKAVILVDLYGSMPEMDKLLAIASARGIAVIEDAAEALGSEFCGRVAGGFGDTSVFSFHGSKTLTTGEGGMLVTDDRDLFDRAQFLRDHGRVPGDVQFFNTEVAYKYKMSSMQAALGLAQLERVDELVQRKRDIFAMYRMRSPPTRGSR